MPVVAKEVSHLRTDSTFFKEMSGETPSANYVIHAYDHKMEGEKYGKIRKLTPAAKSQFVKNRDHIVETIFKLVSEMIADGLDMKRGWIKTRGTNEFDVLIAVPELNYHSTDFDKFHIKVNDLEILFNSLDFHLKIGFINNERPIMEELIYNDGYNLKLDVQQFQKTI